MKQQALKVSDPVLLDASATVTALVKGFSVPQPQEAHTSVQQDNSIYILAAITLGIPLLMMIPLIGMNPGVQEGMLSTVMMFLLFSAFLVAAVFEIKRIADQPSNTDH